MYMEKHSEEAVLDGELTAVTEDEA